MSDQQPMRTPNDLPYGERQATEELQRQQPLRNDPAEISGRKPLQRMRGGGGAEVPPWMTARPSDRPDEPVTEGGPSGPGAGPEALEMYEPTSERKAVLDLLARKGNADAKAMLDSERAPARPMVTPLDAGMSVMGDEETTEDDLA